MLSHTARVKEKSKNEEKEEGKGGRERREEVLVKKIYICKEWKVHKMVKKKMCLYPQENKNTRDEEN